MKKRNSKKNAAQLLEDYRNGTTSAKERALVYSWYLNYQNLAPSLGVEDVKMEEQLALKELQKYLNIKKRTSWKYFTAAASFIICLGIGALYYYTNQTKKQAVAKLSNDFGPGYDQAFLVLANGNKIKASAMPNNSILKQNGASIYRLDNKLVYQKDENSSLLAFNELIVPAKGKYTVKLSDGTVVWLNASSSLKFPASFSNQKNRMVELDGEAYFEVSKNKHQPFIVKTGPQLVTVLGTHFNIKAYKNEPEVKTTLLEGSVKVNNIKLTPNHSAILRNGSLAVTKADTSQAISWKNGFFNFKDENVVSIMRQISHWYDVEIEYRCKTQDKVFNGEFARTKGLAEVLTLLEYTNSIHFKLIGRKVIVMD
jgi:transmembrane sensor